MNGLIRVDLHCHSSVSDGDLSPERVAREMIQSGVEFAALTDHETVDGQERFRAALENHGVGWISGAEIQVQSEWGPLHILAYGIDEQDPAFRLVLRRLRSPLLAYAYDIGGRIWGQLTRRRGNRVGDGKHPFALDGSTEDKANGSLDARLSDQINTIDAFRLIHRVSGRAFLAHPLTGTGGLEQLAEMLPILRAQGLDGIEAFYKPYPPEAQRVLRDLAEHNQLLVSAGSDFHGPSFQNGSSPGLDISEADWDRFLGSIGQTR